MKAVTLGHASYLIQANSTNLLIDPVFGNFFENGDSVPFPDRQIQLNKIPKIDAIFLSHFHDDHFDIESLKVIGIETPIYCPKSAYHILYLKKEGFKNIFTLSPFTPIKLNSLTITPTPSDSPIHLEYGFIFAEKDLYIWNQVDTVITPSILEEVTKKVTSHFHVIFCPYQLLLEHAAYWPQECLFPAQRYKRLKNITKSFNTKFLIPSSSGLKSFEEKMNYGLYPIDINVFKSDLELDECAFKIHCGHPGEELEIYNTEVTFSESNIVICKKKEQVAHPFNPKKFKKLILENHMAPTTSLKWRNFLEHSLIKNLKNCHHKMWINLLNANYKVYISILNGNEKFDFIFLSGKELKLQEIPLSDDWDIRFSYNALDINNFLESNSNFITFRGFYNDFKKNISVLELMGFEPEKVIDGWIGWNPISAHLLEKEYQLD